jgi:ribosomal protein L4
LRPHLFARVVDLGAVLGRKEEQLGLKVSLSDKWRSGNLAVVDKLALDLPKTRLLQEKVRSSTLSTTATDGKLPAASANAARSFSPCSASPAAVVTKSSGGEKSSSTSTRSTN